MSYLNLLFSLSTSKSTPGLDCLRAVLDSPRKAVPALTRISNLSTSKSTSGLDCLRAVLDTPRKVGPFFYLNLLFRLPTSGSTPGLDCLFAVADPPRKVVSSGRLHIFRGVDPKQLRISVPHSPAKSGNPFAKLLRGAASQRCIFRGTGAGEYVPDDSPAKSVGPSVKLLRGRISHGAGAGEERRPLREVAPRRWEAARISGPHSPAKSVDPFGKLLRGAGAGECVPDDSPAKSVGPSVKLLRAAGAF